MGVGAEIDLRRVSREEADLQRDLAEATVTLSVERATERPRAPLLGPFAWFIFTFIFFFVASIVFRCLGSSC
jgi:hypothetical protein